MNALPILLSADWVERVGWTLLHSLWQIALLAALYAIVSALLGNRAASLRYVVGCVGLFAMLGFPLSTYFLLSQRVVPVSTTQGNTLHLAETSATAPAVLHKAVPSEIAVADRLLPVAPTTRAVSKKVSAPATDDPTASVTARFLSALRPWLPGVTLFWLTGTLLFSLRPIWGWLHVHRLQREGLSPLSDTLRQSGEGLVRRLGLKQAVRFAQSALVEVPTVVGFLRPTVLLPASVITGLSVREIELILAHELAHVRRHDFVVNFVQTVVETILFYHPGVWWLSNRIRQERENCCDDMAVAFVGNRTAYVQALARLEQQRLSTPAAVLAATGGSLLARVRRLLGKPHREFGYFHSGTSLAGLAILSAVALVAGLAMAMVRREPMDFDFQNPPGAYEKGIRAADADHEIKAGALRFKLSDITRDRDGAVEADLGLEEGYEIISFRLFDHSTRKLLHDSHWQLNLNNDPSTKKFHIQRVGESERVRIEEKGGQLPESVDLWLRVVENGRGEQIVIPTREGAAVKHKKSEIVVTSLLAGFMNGRGSPSGKMIWDTGSATDTNWRTTLSLENRGPVLRGRYHIVAVTKSGRRHAMDHTHFLDFSRLGRHQYKHLDVGPAEIDHFELIPFKARHKFFFNGVQVPEIAALPEEADDASEKRVEVDDLSEAIADRVVRIIERQDQPFIQQEQLKNIRAEFRQLVQKHAPENMSEDRKQAILTAIDEHGREHLLLGRYDPDSTEMRSLNLTYLTFPDRLKSLQWKLYEALQRGPLNAEERARLEAQRQFLRNHITGLPEVRSVKHEPVLLNLNTRFMDPLSTILDHPLTEEQFTDFIEILQSYPREQELSYVVPHIVGAAVRVNSLNSKEIRVPFVDRIISSGHSNDIFDLGFESNRKFRSDTRGLGDLETTYTVIDATTGYPDQGPAEFRDPDRFDRWLDQHGRGDFGYSTAEQCGLVAVRGAKLALLDVKNWIEVDAISDIDLRAEIKNQNKSFVSLQTYYETHRDRHKTYPPLTYFGPYIGLLTKEGNLSVIHVEDFSGREQIAIRTRPPSERRPVPGGRRNRESISRSGLPPGTVRHSAGPPDAKATLDEEVTPVANETLRPENESLDLRIRRAFRFMETSDTGLSAENRPVQVFAGLEHEGELDLWRPQMHSWSSDPRGDEHALRMPLWALTEPLPVDLCFKVEIKLTESGELLEGVPIIIPRGKKAEGYFMPEHSQDIWKKYDGFVPLTVKLSPFKPPEPRYARLTKIWQGTLVSEPLRAKSYQYKASDASPLVRELCDLLSDLAGIDANTASPTEVHKALLAKGVEEQTAYHIQNMASLSPYNRQSGASVSGSDSPAAIPFLIKLLEDVDSLPLQPPANGAVRSLTSIGPAAIPALLEKLKQAKPAVRVKVVYLFNNMATNERREEMKPLVLSHLIRLLGDEHEPLRAAATHALHRFVDSRAVEPLIAALSDESPKVRANAAMALGWNRDARAVPALVKTLNDEVDQVRSESATALGTIRSPNCLEPLIRALKKDKFSRVRREAAWGLAYLKDTRADSALLTALKDESPDVVTAAAYGLGEMKIESAIGPLIQAMQRGPNARRAAARALKKITGQDFGEEAVKWKSWHETGVDAADKDSRVPVKDRNQPDQTEKQKAKAEPLEDDSVTEKPKFPSARNSRSSVTRSDRNAIWFHTGGYVHFVLYHEGFLQTGLEYSQYQDTRVSPSLWKFRGQINALGERYELNAKERGADRNRFDWKRKRQFELAFAYSPPDLTLSIDGREYDLSSGRVFVLNADGAPTQLSLKPPPVSDRKKIDELSQRIQKALADDVGGSLGDPNGLSVLTNEVDDDSGGGNPAGATSLQESETSTKAIKKESSTRNLQHSDLEKKLLGPWYRSSFLSYEKLTILPNRTYRYEYITAKGDPHEGKWRIENETQLVYEYLQPGSETVNTTRWHIISIDEKEVKLKQLSPKSQNKIITYTRVAAAPNSKQKKAEADPIPLGKVVELTVNDDNPQLSDYCIDFETGRLFSIPDKFRKGRNGPPKVFEKWIVPNGIDAMGETKDSVKGLIGFDIVAKPFAGPSDRLPDISENRLSSQFVDAVPGRPVAISGKGELPATYLFQTREGTRGVLQIVGFEDDPRGVRIRYKLISRKKVDTTKGQPVILLDADTKNADIVLDLSSGELVRPPTEGDLLTMAALDKGDLAFDRVLVCVRGTTVMQWSGDRFVRFPPKDRIQDATAYELPSLPCRLLITTAEGKHFDVTILSRMANNAGVRLKYQEADPAVVPKPAPAKAEPRANESATEKSKTVDELIVAFSAAPTFWQHGDVARELIALGDPAIIPQIEKALDTQDRRRRCNAGLVLAGLGDPRGLAVIIKELQDKTLRPTEMIRSDGKPNPEGQMRSDRYYAALLLGQLGNQEAVPVLIQMTQDATINARAAISLGEIGDKRAIPALRKMAEDFPDERLSAGSGLAALGEPAGFAMLAEVIRAEPRWTERRHAVEALGKSGHPLAVPTVVKALKDPHVNVRVSAARALGAIGNPTALPALTEALNDRELTKINAPTTVEKEARQAIEAINSSPPERRHVR